MIASYSPTAECQIIKEVHNKHHCHVPPEVWGITPEIVCQVCRLKNQALFVEVALASNPPGEDVSNVIQFQQPIRRITEPRVTKQQPCRSCARGRIYVKLWNTGVRICCECREKEKARLTKLANTTKSRSCRICGKTGLKSCAWRKAHNICRSAECWNKLMQEMKFAI